ncbi:hypothetical protein [Pseudomonas nitroreducens]|uniref:hypothetical protein n=1 Tax=Pseudomonas nitroreducens TaxID=46680 RepID=UPI0011302004|nr:hypothetical protein [Pseudomonas nitroreducens]
MATIVKIPTCTRNAFLLEEGYPTTSQAFRTKSTNRARHVDVMRSQYGSTNSPRFDAENKEFISLPRIGIAESARPLEGHSLSTVRTCAALSQV